MSNDWNDLFGKENEPTNTQITDFIATPLWSDLAYYVQQTYNIQPKTEYSSCAMDGGIWKGWNVKYKKSGKSLCTLYPKHGYFLSLITVSAKEAAEADLLIPLCCEYVQGLWNKAEPCHFGKILGIEVTKDEILRDVKELIALRVKPRK